MAHRYGPRLPGLTGLTRQTEVSTTVVPGSGIRMQDGAQLTDAKSVQIPNFSSEENVTPPPRSR